MTVRVGNAGSPRWYDLSMRRLDEYINRLVEWGAGSAELVLHHGETDERIARVHVVGEDWVPVFERYHAHGLMCHVHGPLHPRFKLDRLKSDPAALQAEWSPVLDAVARFTQRQGATAELIVHAASSDPESSARFARWASAELQVRGGGGIAIELRKPRSDNDRGFDRRRAALVDFVAALDDARIGICWDIGHDWEGHQRASLPFEPPAAAFLDRVRHVHLHDAGGDPLDVHFPLQSGVIPWRTQLGALLDRGFGGSATLELRYRYALALGEPWEMLAGSYALVRSYLRQQETWPTATQAGERSRNSNST